MYFIIGIIDLRKKNKIPIQFILQMLNFIKKKEFCIPHKQWFNKLYSIKKSLLNNIFSRNLFNNSNLNKHKTLFIITKI